MAIVSAIREACHVITVTFRLDDVTLAPCTGMGHDDLRSHRGLDKRFVRCRVEIALPRPEEADRAPAQTGPCAAWIGAEWGAGTAVRRP